MNSLKLTIRLALAGLNHNKTRAFLTMLGIIIGVSSVIAIISLGKGAQSLITNSLESVGTNLVAVLPGASNDSGPPAAAFGIVTKTLTIDDALAIEKLPLVKEISPAVSGADDLTYRGKITDGNFVGVYPAYLTVENQQVERGRFINEADLRGKKKVIVLGNTVKNELFGDASPIGKTVRIGDASFQVIGYLESKGSSFFQNPDTQVYVPLTTAQSQLLDIQHLNVIRATVISEVLVNQAKDQIRDLLMVRHDIRDPDAADFSVRSISQALDVFGGITSGLTFFLASIAAVSLLVGGIGITNVMMMTVTERTKEIGLRKALGARPKQIRNQFVVETLVLTLIGGFIGMILGIGFSYFVAVLLHIFGYTWDFVISVQSIILSIGISVFIGLVFGLYPARKASNLNPIEALRYE